MPKFRYRLQNILDIKLKLEEQQKMILLSKSKILTAEKEELDKLIKRKQAYEENIRINSVDTLDVFNIKNSYRDIKTMEYLIKDKKNYIDKLEVDFAKEEEKLIKAMQDRKIYEKLKEKSIERFLEAEIRYENNLVDELVAYKYTDSKEELI